MRKSIFLAAFILLGAQAVAFAPESNAVVTQQHCSQYVSVEPYIRAQACVLEDSGNMKTLINWTATGTHPGCIMDIELRSTSGNENVGRTVTCAGSGNYYGYSNPKSVVHNKSYFGSGSPTPNYATVVSPDITGY